MDVYKSRHPQPPGTRRRHVGICLTPEQWRVFERAAEESEESLAYIVSRFLALCADLYISEGYHLRLDEPLKSWVMRTAMLYLEARAEL